MRKIYIWVLPALGAAVLGAQEHTITTVAGGAPTPTPIKAVQASIGVLSGVTADAQGNVYFTSQNSVFRVDVSGIMTRIAGNSRPGYSGDGGVATSAQLNSPFGVAVDASGNLFIGDTENSRIRKVSVAGIITTIAGNGSHAYSGDGGAAINAQLNRPHGVAVDASGDLFVADTDNALVRKISAAGIITTVAGNGGPQGYSGDGGAATSAALFEPFGVAVDAFGNLFIADVGNITIRKVSAAGIITTVAGNGSEGNAGDGGSATSAQLYMPVGVAVDPFGNIYIAEQFSGLRKVSAAGIVTTVATIWLSTGAYGDVVYGPQGVSVDGSGNLFVADEDNRIKRVSPAGILTTIAGNGLQSYSGNGGSATSAQIDNPFGVAVDASGNLFISDPYNDVIRKVSAAGIITTVAGNGAGTYSGDGGPATSAYLSSPFGVAVDASGNLFIADGRNDVIRKVSAAGIITTVAGNASQGYSGDGGAATNAQLNSPHGVAVDASGNLFIADTHNDVVRKVSAAGIITTVAGNGSQGYSGDGGAAASAQLDSPFGVAVDALGNLFIADFDNSKIRKVSAAGIITTVAGTGGYGYSGDGGPATSAGLYVPQGVAVDAFGNLFIADTQNSRIRKVSAAGIITTVAGDDSYSYSYSGDGGAATSAQLDFPQGVAVDASGNVFIADANGGNAVRRLTPAAVSCPNKLSATSFNPSAGGGDLALTITTDSGCAWSISNFPDWITVSGPSTGSGNATFTLIVAANSGPPRSAQIIVAGINVTVSQASNILLVSTGGVVNGASYTQPVAPGSITAIFGNFLLPTPVGVDSFPIPSMLGGLSFGYGGGVFSPLFYANYGQANGQLPWELSGQTQATITATNSGQMSAAQPVSLTTYAPGLFAINGQGTGQGAILDLNYHLVDSANPVSTGSYVQIYCTGLGPVTNQPQTGAPAPAGPLAQTTSTPTVMIGGAPAGVQFSGLTPGLVGLYQVNAQVPEGAAKGNAEPVVLTIGSVQSNVVTIAIQ